MKRTKEETDLVRSMKAHDFVAALNEEQALSLSGHITCYFCGGRHDDAAPHSKKVKTLGGKEIPLGVVFECLQMILQANLMYPRTARNDWLRCFESPDSIVSKFYDTFEKLGRDMDGHDKEENISVCSSVQFDVAIGSLIVSDVGMIVYDKAEMIFDTVCRDGVFKGQLLVFLERAECFEACADWALKNKDPSETLDADEDGDFELLYGDYREETECEPLV